MVCLNHLEIKKWALGLLLQSFTHFEQCIFPAGLCSILEGRDRALRASSLWWHPVLDETFSPHDQSSSSCFHWCPQGLTPCRLSDGCLALKGSLLKSCTTTEVSHCFLWLVLGLAHACHYLLPLCGQFHTLPRKGQIQQDVDSSQANFWVCWGTSIK